MRIDNSVAMAGYACYAHQIILGGSGGTFPQEILDFCIFLERFWCFLSTLVDKQILRILENYLYH